MVIFAFVVTFSEDLLAGFGRFPRWHLVKRETLEWWRIEQAVRTKRSVDVRRIENASFNKTCLQGGRKWHPI